MFFSRKARNQLFFSGFSVSPCEVGQGAESLATGDLDGDGVPDLAVANRDADSVSILLGDGVGGFARTSDVTVGDLPLSVAVGEFNGDGFPDIIATGRSHYTSGKLISQQQRNYLLLNQGNDHNWVKVKLTGTKSNRSAFNARVKVTSGDHVVTRELYSSTGYNSVDDPALIFGLGHRDKIDSVEVTWPSGTVQRLDNVSPGQTVEITEPE